MKTQQMPQVPPQLSADELAEILGEVVDDYLDRLNRGESPQAAEYMTRHPECASTIQQALRALEVMEQSLTSCGNPSVDPRWRPDRQLGDFQIVAEIGRGGMGIVYEAEQLSMGGRKVALKVLPFATLVDPKRLMRFQNEVRAIASLEHPHIVAVFAVGEQRGVHFFAMQLVRGQSVATVINQIKILRAQGLNSSIIDLLSDSKPSKTDLQIDASNGWVSEIALIADANVNRGDVVDSGTGNKVTSAEHPETQSAFRGETINSSVTNQFCRSVAEIGVQAAEALAYAHEQGIVHRDIKPANLMLDVAGKVYLTDFGLAQMEQETGLSMTGDLIGTLRYMAPEQALGKRVPIDHRVDVYSLGVSLYELLTTVPAFSSENRAELLNQISFQEPKSLRQIDPSIPVDLETVVHKAMAKNPEDRYLTAQDFADDLKRYLTIQPVLARSTSLLQRGMKWTARHQEITWLAVIALSLIALITSYSVWQATRKNELLTQSNRSLQTQTALAQKLEQEARQAQAQTQKEKRAVESERNRALDNLYLADMRQAARYLEAGQFEQLLEVLEKYITDQNEHDLRRWEWYYFLSQCFAADKIISGHTRGVFDVKWNSDGTKLATASEDNTVRIWDAKTNHELLLTRPRSWGIQTIDWSPDAQQMIIGGIGGTSDKPGGNVLIWNLDQNVEPTLEYSGSPISDVAWSPDGRYFSFGEETDPAAFTAWDTVANRQAARDSIDGEGLNVIAWSDDGTWVTLAAGQRIVKWDIEQRRELSGWKAHDTEINGLKVSHDNLRIASGSFDGTLKIWDAGSDKELLSIDVGSSVNSIDWSPEDRFLAVGTRGQTIQILETDTGKHVRALRGHSGPINAVDWHPSEFLIASASRDRTARIWDVSDLDTIEQRDSPKTRTSADVERLVGPHRAIWRISDEGSVLEIGTPNMDTYLVKVDLESTDPLAFNADWHPSQRIAFPNGSQIEVWDLSKQPQRLCRFSGHQADVLNVEWSHDGAQLASSSFDGTLRIWNLATQNIEKTLLGHDTDHFVSGIAWSPNDMRIAAGGWDRTVRIWHVESGLETQVLRGHTEFVEDVTWSPEGDRIASRQSSGRSIKLWDPNTGDELLSLRYTGEGLGLFGWSEDGARLTSGESVFDATKGRVALESAAYSINAAWRHFDRAMELANSGRFAEAEAAWARALVNNPELAETEGDMGRMASAARFQFGYLLTQKQDHHRAIEVYRQAIDQFPTGSFAYFGMSQSLFDLGEYDRAIQTTLQGAQIDPTANPFRSLAERFDSIGDYARALACYEKAYEGRPDRFENINNLAWFLATCPNTELRDAKRAVELATTAGQKAPKAAGFWNTLGVAHYRNGDFTASLNALKKSVQLKSEEGLVNPDGYDLFFLAMAQSKLGTAELARRNFARGIAWMERFAPEDDELRRFHDEAETLMNRKN